MKRSFVPVCLIVSCLTASASELAGVWELQYGKLAGLMHGVARGTEIRLTVHGTTWKESSTNAGAPGYVAQFTTNDRSTPRQIDLVISSDAHRTTWRGIYKIEGDKLTVCRTRGVSRPTKFDSTPYNDVLMFVYRRMSRENP